MTPNLCCRTIQDWSSSEVSYSQKKFSLRRLFFYLFLDPGDDRGFFWDEQPSLPKGDEFE